MEALFEKYKNIQLFIKKRGYTLLENKPSSKLRGKSRDEKVDELKQHYFTYDDFVAKMHAITYVVHYCFDERRNRYVDIYLIKPDSPYLKSQKFKKILSRYSLDKPRALIFITKEEFGTFVRRAIVASKLPIYAYLQKHFIIELNKGPLCSHHRLLNSEEQKRICYEIMKHPHNFPSILQNDPQNIWIGGEVGDIILIEGNSEISGHYEKYRIVTPNTGKIAQAAILPKEKTKSEEKEETDTEVEPSEEEPDDEPDDEPDEEAE